LLAADNARSLTTFNIGWQLAVAVGVESVIKRAGKLGCPLLGLLLAFLDRLVKLGRWLNEHEVRLVQLVVLHVHEARIGVERKARALATQLCPAWQGVRIDLDDVGERLEP